MIPQPRFAFTGVIRPVIHEGEDGYMIGRADEGIPGYTPVPSEGTFAKYDEAQARANRMNETLGLEPGEAWKIVASTLQGGSS